jgi:SAM-dependent methyltransferase
LRGRRVLDAGCGTGRLAVLLAEGYGCKVWGVDPSPEMIEVARARVPEGVGLRIGRAEDLPFKNGWFERAAMTLVLQLVDRPAALAELRRVLAPGGRLAIATFDYAHFEGYFLGRYFPSFEELDKARFPSATGLEEELRAAGFASVRITRLTQHETVGREAVLERIRGKHISTFQLIGEEEYRSGLERAERELPERMEHALEWLVAVAIRN